MSNESMSIHPIYDPLGDSHHTDVPFTDEDRALANRLAHFCGTFFDDIDGFTPDGVYQYWYRQRTSVDEWSRVTRALRIHGLRIVDSEERLPVREAA